MPASTTPIFPNVPYAVNGSLASATACTTRAPTPTASLAAANITLLCPATTNGLRVDKIAVQACSNSIAAATVAQTVLIWMWDGTNAYVVDEFVVTAQAPSATATAFRLEKSYSNLVLPAAFALYHSTTVTTTSSTTALSTQVFGGAY